MKIHPAWKFNLSEVELTNHTIDIRGLDRAFQGYRIIQISDFHLGSWFKPDHLKDVVKTVNDLNPDLIAITGDILNHMDRRILPDLASTLAELRPKDVSVAVLGNHDHWSNANLIRDVLKQSHVIDLSNSVICINRGEAKVYIAGIDDFYTGHDDLKKVLTHVPDGHPAILLAHEPDFIEVSSVTRRFSLQLSGHTHGGQIILPLLGPLYLPLHGRKYPGGIYQVGETVLYTNRGLGTSWLGLRLNCPPEIAIFTLQSTKGNMPTQNKK